MSLHCKHVGDNIHSPLMIHINIQIKTYKWSQCPNMSKPYSQCIFVKIPHKF